MTIEELIVISQREYETIRNEMATREELRATEGNILRAIEGIGLQLAGYESRWNGDLDNLTDTVQAIERRQSARKAKWVTNDIILSSHQNKPSLGLSIDRDPQQP